MKYTSFDTAEVLERGVAEILPGKESLAEKLAAGPLRLYLGIDPTGSTLHLGHSVVLRKLQQFAQLGHQVILLVGNGTVKIGDPTGRDESRPMLTDEAIKANFSTWKEQASKILDFSRIEVRYNGDWLDGLHFSQIVKLMAKTTVQQLIERDMFQERIKKGLPIYGHEIMYPLLQGYDSVAMDVDLEIGGTDQTFNMMMGRTLQKIYNNKEKWVLTTPVINGTDGRKMSKSFGNYVALTEPPIDMYGKLMRVADEMIAEYFSLLTDVHQEEINALKADMERGGNPMRWKKQLAWEITRMYHSEKDADMAQTHFESTIQNKTLSETVEMVQRSEIQGKQAFEVVALLTGESNTAARKLIEQGAFILLPTGTKITTPTAIPDLTQATGLRIGKRRLYKLA